MFGKKKKSSVDEVFESVVGDEMISFCKFDHFKVTCLTNAIKNGSPDQINYTLKQLGKDDSKTRHIINQVVLRLSGKA